MNKSLTNLVKSQTHKILFYLRLFTEKRKKILKVWLKISKSSQKPLDWQGQYQHTSQQQISIKLRKHQDSVNWRIIWQRNWLSHLIRLFVPWCLMIASSKNSLANHWWPWSSSLAFILQTEEKFRTGVKSTEQ